MTSTHRRHCDGPPPAPARRRFTALAACSGAALLAGCSGTLLPKPPPPPARHTLDGGGPTQPPRPPRADAPVLVVATPTAAPGHDTRRMVYLRRAQELEAFAFHEWVEPPALMLAPLLVRALQDGGAFRAVLQAPSAATGGWRLETELVRLQQDFGMRPSQLRLGLRAVLLDSRTRQVIAWREFDSQVATASDDPTAGVRAAHQATVLVLAALVAFCAEQVQRAGPSKPSVS